MDQRPDFDSEATRRVLSLESVRKFAVVAEERHFGRAAARLHMTQPPLSRAIRQLERELGADLLERTVRGVALTPAGAALYDEARTLLEHAEQVRTRVAAAAGADVVTVGTLADSAEWAGPRLVAAFRERHPGVSVRVHEADLSDPDAGLRAGLVDVALTRAPFDTAGIRTRVLRADPVGVVVPAEDPLAGRDSVGPGDLAGRRWVRLPDGTDAVWRAYWQGGTDSDGTEAPPVRTIQECLQAVLWNGAAAIAPLGQALPDGLACVPLAGKPPSRLVVAWPEGRATPLVRAFVAVAADVLTSDGS